MKVILFTLMFSISSFAYLNKQLIQKKDGDHYLISYSENGRFLFDHIFIQNKKLQELKLRKIFDSKQKLLNYKKSFLLRNFKQSKNIQKHRFSKRLYSVTETNKKSVWTVKNKWSLDWENKFADWISKELNKDYFVKYNLPTDCADVAFALRWIFARDNYLPAANTLAGSHIIFSQDSMKKEWENLPGHKLWHKDEVFLSALKYLMLHAYTGTLSIDGYPIEINRESFLPGTIHLDGGHTMIISQIDYKRKLAAPIYRLSSTVPAAVRSLLKEIMIDEKITDKEEGGLYRMRWPLLVNNKWSLVPKEKMPLYSLEQYSDDFLEGEKSFTLALIKRLEIDFIPKKVIDEAIASIKSSLTNRIKVVQDAYDFCLENNCDLGSFNYEEYSTPTRDKRIRTKFQTLKSLADQFLAFDNEIHDYLEKKLTNDFLIVNNRTRTLLEYQTLFNLLILSYSPSDSIDKRWALNKTAMISTINERFIERTQERTDLINRSKFCTLDQCKKGTENFLKYNTYKFDDALKREVLLAYNFIKNSYKGIGTLNTEISKIAFYSSNPYSEDKWGHSTNEDYFLVSGKDITELNENLIWTDGEVISVDTKKKFSLKEVGPESFYLANTNQIVTSNKNKFLVYDINGNILFSKTFEYDIASISWLSDKYFTLQLQTDSGQDNLTSYEIHKNGIDKIETFSNGSYSSFGDSEKRKEVRVISKEDHSAQLIYTFDDDIIVYVQNGVYIKKRLNRQIYESLSLNHNKMLYLKSPGILQIEDLETNQSCSINVPKKYTYWNFSEDPSFIIGSYDEGEEPINQFYSMFRLEDCHSHLIKEFGYSYIDLSKLEAINIVRQYFNNSSDSNIYIFRDDQLTKIPLGSKSFIYSIDEKNTSVYFNATNNNDFIVSGQSFNYQTGKLTKLPKNILYSFCTKEDVINIFCSKSKHTRTTALFLETAQLKTMYTTIEHADTLKIDTYVEIPEQSFYESLSKLNTTSYNAFRVVDGYYLFLKKAQ